MPRRRHHAGGERRGGVRGGRHVRDPTAAEGAARGRAHHRRRMGRRHRRRDQRGIGDLELVDLPDDLLAAIDAQLPPRWSRNNPVDCAGGETRDTIPTVLRADRRAPRGRRDRVPRARHPVEPGAHDARGAASIPATASSGSSSTTSGRTAASPRRPPSSSRTGKPILCATELAVADPANAGPAAVRATGRLCYPSGERAVTALGHLYRYARYRQRRTS